jgi:hypothetical protein
VIGKQNFFHFLFVLFRAKMGQSLAMKYSGLCQLADDLSRRVIEFGGEHPLANENDYKGSVQFQDEAASLQIQGVLRIGGVRRDRDLNFFYPLSDFGADLHQLARRKDLKDPKLPLILLQTVEVLLAVRERFQRTHGALALESILVRDPAAKKPEIVLTDFLPKPKPGTPPDKYEKDDLRALGQIIAAAATINREQDTFDSRQLYASALPPPDDEEASSRFGNRWPVLQMLADDLLSPGGPQVNSTLEQIQEQLQRLVGVTPAVRKRPQTLSFGPLPDKRVGEPPFQIAATASSGLPVSLSIVSGQSFAAVRGNTVTLLGAGKVGLKATQPGNEQFQPADEVVREFNISKATQSIEFAPLPDRALDAPPFDLIARASSGLPIRFTVVSGRADIQGSRLTLRGVGVIEIKARQEGNPNYEAAESVRALRVTGRSQTIRLERPADKFLGDPPFSLNASASSGLEVSFRIPGGPARVTGNRVTLDGTGTVTLVASQPGNEEYSPAPEATCTFEVKERERARKPQTITFTPVGTRANGDRPFRLFARSDAGLPVSFSIESGPAQVTGDELKLTGAGQVVLRATQSGNADYAPAEATQTFLVTKARQTVSFGPLPRDLAVGNSVVLQATVSSGLAVNFAIASGKGELTGNQLTLTAAGAISLKASQSGDQNYEPAEAVQTASVAKGKQTITFEALPGEARFGETITLGARASSGLPVTLAMVSGPATVAGSQLTLQGTGEVKIRATQAGDTNYNAAAEQLQTLNIAKAAQTIRFDQWPRELKVDESFTLGASASSGLPVSFNLLSGPANLADNRLTTTAAGRVQIEAIQSGNENYQPAINTQSVKAAKRTQEIHFDELLDRNLNEPVFALSATASSKLPVTFNVVSGPAKIQGKEVTVLGRGLVEIEATQAGDARYEPAPALTRSLTVIDPKRKQRLIFAALLGGLVTGAAGVALALVLKYAEPTLGKVGEQILETSQSATNIQLEIKVDKRLREKVEVTPQSDNPTVVEVSTTGTGDNQQLVLTPKATGETTVSLTVKDGRGHITEPVKFGVKVTPKAVAPILGELGPVPKLEEGDQEAAIALPVTVQTPWVSLAKVTVEPTVEPAGIVSARTSYTDDRWQLVLTPQKAGTASVTVTVKDQRGLASKASHFSVKVTAKRVAPILGELKPVTLQEGADPIAVDLPLTIQAPEVSMAGVDITNILDPPGILSVRTKFTGNAWQLILTPISNGLATVTVKATDERMLAGKASSFTVTVSPKPVAPVFGEMTAAPVLEEGKGEVAVDLPVKVQTPVVSLAKAIVASTVQPSDLLAVRTNFTGGRWQLMLRPLKRGLATLKVTVTDERGQKSKDFSFSVKVQPKPVAPVLGEVGSVPPLEVGAQPTAVDLPLTVQTELVSLSKVTISPTVAPPGLLSVRTNFTGDRWQLMLTPQSPGVATVTLTAKDERDQPCKSSISFSVTVNPKSVAPVVSVPSLPALEEGGQAAVVDLSVTVQTPIVSVAKTTITPTVEPTGILTASTNYTGGRWQLSLKPQKAGWATVTLRATDERGLSGDPVHFRVTIQRSQKTLANIARVEQLAVWFSVLKSKDATRPEVQREAPIDRELYPGEAKGYLHELQDLKSYFSGQSPNPKFDFPALERAIGRHQ